MGLPPALHVGVSFEIVSFSKSSKLSSNLVLGIINLDLRKMVGFWTNKSPPPPLKKTTAKTTANVYFDFKAVQSNI